MNFINDSLNKFITELSDNSFEEWAISKNLSIDLSALEKRFPRAAIQSTGETYYETCKDSVSQKEFNVVFLNRSKFKIEFTYEDNISIDLGLQGLNPTIKTGFKFLTQMIAYHVKEHPLLICFEVSQKIKNRPLLENRFFVDLNKDPLQFEMDKENIIYKISERVHQKSTLPSLLLGYQDEGSFFLKNAIPKDILYPIFVQYDRCTEAGL